MESSSSQARTSTHPNLDEFIDDTKEGSQVVEGKNQVTAVAEVKGALEKPVVLHVTRPTLL